MTRLNKFTEIGRKVVAVGRNYADHAKELGNAVGPSLNNPRHQDHHGYVEGANQASPLHEADLCLHHSWTIHLHPPRVHLLLESSRIKSLCRCNDLHHEIELGVVVGKQAKKVAESEAMGYVGGYCLALDMTARF